VNQAKKTLYEECRFVGRFAVRLLLEPTISEERIAAVIKEKRIGELETLAVRGLLRLLVTANVPRSPILVTLIMEAIRYSETSVLTNHTALTTQVTAFFIVTAV
jgi:hypothetical protein